MLGETRGSEGTIDFSENNTWHTGAYLRCTPSAGREVTHFKPSRNQWQSTIQSRSVAGCRSHHFDRRLAGCFGRKGRHKDDTMGPNSYQT